MMATLTWSFCSDEDQTETGQWPAGITTGSTRAPPRSAKMLSLTQYRPGAGIMTCFRVTSLFIGFAVACVDFSAFAFTIYFNDLKETFNYTQSEVETLMSLNFLGLGAAFPAGMFAHRFGVHITAFLSTVVSTISYLLIYDACMRSYLYYRRSYLLAIYFFTAGSGLGSSYICAMTANIRNFPHTVHGFVTGFITSGCNIGPMIYIAIYINIYAPDIASYFLFVAIYIFVVNALGLISYGYYPTTEMIQQSEEKRVIVDHEKTEYGGTEKVEEETKVVKTEIGGTVRLYSLWEMFCMPKTHFLVWPSVVMLGVQGTTTGDLTSFSMSVGLGSYIGILPYVALGTSLASTVILSAASDILISVMPRYAWVVFGLSINCLTCLLAIFALNNLGVVVFCLVVWNMGSSIVTFAIPAIIIQEFGMASFSRLWGFTLCCCAITIAVLQNISGAIYDLALVGTDETTCYGLQCFGGTFGLLFVLMILGVSLFCFYVRRLRQSQSNFTK